MQITRVFNNNVVLAVDDAGREVVLLGRGLGFQATPGDEVTADRINKRFVPGGSTSAERLVALIDEIPPEDLELSEEIVTAARQTLGEHITDAVTVPLADHLSIALRRATEGVAELDYPLRWEVQHLYPAEARFGREALRIVEHRRAIRLPDVESVPIALHFVNAQFGAMDLDTTLRMTELLRETLEVVHATFGLTIDENAVPVGRFVTHLRYLFHRQQQPTTFAGTVDPVLDAIRLSHPREHGCALRLADLLRERFGWGIGEEEILYLTLHVARMTTESRSSPATPARDPETEG